MYYNNINIAKSNYLEYRRVRLCKLLKAFMVDTIPMTTAEKTRGDINDSFINILWIIEV